jgi:hypothetical protein
LSGVKLLGHSTDPRSTQRWLAYLLAEAGDPSISMHVEGQVIVLSADTAPIMLRSRVMAAIEDVAGDQGQDVFGLA